jgi:hypothetical protein
MKLTGLASIWVKITNKFVEKMNVLINSSVEACRRLGPIKFQMNDVELN